jgi:hypothetical protein
MLKNSVKALLHSSTNAYKSVTLKMIISKSVENSTGRPLQKLKRVSWSTTLVFVDFEL